VTALPLAQPALSIIVCKSAAKSGDWYDSPETKGGTLSQSIPAVNALPIKSAPDEGAVGFASSSACKIKLTIIELL